MSTKKNKICPDCGKKIWDTSIHCRSCSKKGKLGSFFGKHHTQKNKDIIGKSHWKGEKAKYKAKHIWVNSRKGIAKICEKCGITFEKARIEWTNKDHKYSRNLDDYFSLCCSCHLKYDLANGLRTYIPKQDSITGKFIPI